jgi:hypothetical protein
MPEAQPFFEIISALLWPLFSHIAITIAAGGKATIPHRNATESRAFPPYLQANHDSPSQR